MVQDVSCGSYPFSLSNVVPGVVDAAKDARAAEILFLMTYDCEAPVFDGYSKAGCCKSVMQFDVGLGA